MRDSDPARSAGVERLRVLQVIHQFPPHSSQGSEVYCENLSTELARTEEVGVFHTSDARAGWRRALRREKRAGFEVYHCIDRGQYARLADRSNDFLRRSFLEVLSEFRPSIVHFHNYLSLGDPLVSMARASGARVVYTLHDYGLICPRVLLMRDDGALCAKMRPDFFQDCCPDPIRPAPRLAGGWLSRLPSLERWERFASERPALPQAVIRGAATTIRALSRGVGDSAAEDLERKRQFFFRQTRQIFADTELFIAPSRFLLERYVSCGIAADKIVYSDYGLRHFRTPTSEKRNGAVRFGYIGALHAQKGVDLLIEAFRGIEGGRLDVHGSTFGSPVSEGFAARLRRQAGASVFFHGAYENDRVGAILAAIDVLVVPSVWYENSPLTIHEAFIAGVPVLTADRGGMAELVRNGGGLMFRLGDAADLRDKIRGVIEQPSIVEELRRTIPAVKTIEADAVMTARRYRELLRPSASPSTVSIS